MSDADSASDSSIWFRFVSFYCSDTTSWITCDSCDSSSRSCSPVQLHMMNGERWGFALKLIPLSSEVILPTLRVRAASSHHRDQTRHMLWPDIINIHYVKELKAHEIKVSVFKLMTGCINIHHIKTANGPGGCGAGWIFLPPELCFHGKLCPSALARCRLPPEPESAHYQTCMKHRWNKHQDETAPYHSKGALIGCPPASLSV